MRYDFDHTGLRLDTDYSPVLRDSRARADRHLSQALREIRERLRPQDFCFLGFSLYCATPNPGNHDYHEHTSGATFQTSYFKKATLAASYYWGDGVNFVALPPASGAPPTPYNQPFVAREETRLGLADRCAHQAAED